MASRRQWQPPSRQPPPTRDAPHPWSGRLSAETQEVSNQPLTTADIVAAQSQDYVDERELEFRQTIQHLAGSFSEQSVESSNVSSSSNGSSAISG